MSNVTLNSGTVYCMAGPQASGKSTLISSILNSYSKWNIEVISPDNFIYDENKIYNWTPERAGYAWNSAFGLLDSTIKNGIFQKKVDVILFDAMFVNSKSRKDFVSRIHGYNIPCGIIALPVVDIETLLKRNSTRTSDRQIPEDSIIRCLKTYEQSRQYISSEGFDHVIML